jgi:hypothetical protein
MVLAFGMGDPCGEVKGDMCEGVTGIEGIT